MILCGILNDGRSLVEKLEASGLTKGDFYSDLHQRAFDLFAYVSYGSPAPILADVFIEGYGRRTRLSGILDGSFHSQGEFCGWLVDLWNEVMMLADEPGTGGWRKGMYFWADAESEETHCTWAALAAAAKVRHLSRRRQAIYAAMEALRDAGSPAGSSTDLDETIGQLGEY